MTYEDCCPEKPSLAERDLINENQALSVVSMFKVLSNDTRLKILHALVREPNLSVGDIATLLHMKVQAVSNQLQTLVSQNIIKPNRDGNFIKYQIVDDCTLILLERAWCLAEDTGKITVSDEVTQ